MRAPQAMQVVLDVTRSKTWMRGDKAARDEHSLKAQFYWLVF